MFHIAYVESQTQIRRSVMGALATDPVRPEGRPRRRRARVTGAGPRFLRRGGGTRTIRTNEAPENA